MTTSKFPGYSVGMPLPAGVLRLLRSVLPGLERAVEGERRLAKLPHGQRVQVDIESVNHSSVVLAVNWMGWELGEGGCRLHLQWPQQVARVLTVRVGSRVERADGGRPFGLQAIREGARLLARLRRARIVLVAPAPAGFLDVVEMAERSFR